MKIRIYQINLDRDEDRVAFESLDHLERYQGSSEIKSSIYDMVYEGEVDCAGLEDVFRMFNLDHPADYMGRSLSVSDVVEVMGIQPEQDISSENDDRDTPETQAQKPGFFFCDSYGFKQVEFDAEAAKKPERETIRVVLVEPGKLARITEIGKATKQMQAVVGGDIQTLYPFKEEVCIVSNDEGKNIGLPLNRAIREEETEVEMSYNEMVARFRNKERQKDKKHLTGYVVITEDSFEESYPVESRTYAVSSNNKAFQPNMGGYSIYASAIDGSDPMVRLERYLAVEKGGADGWKIERCYMKEQGREIIDIIAGTFFICDCSGERLDSLNDEQLKRYEAKFRLPEDFLRIGGKIIAVPYKPKNKEKER